MGTRTLSHQLSGGLYVSGPPEQLKERQPVVTSRAVPYTGGDVKKSGELGKMFDIPVIDPNKGNHTSSSSSANRSGSHRSATASNSGPLYQKPSKSGPVLKKSSGPHPLQPTGLITSGPLGPTAVGRRSGQLAAPSSKPVNYGPAVTTIGEDTAFAFKISKPIMWVALVAFVIGTLVGVFMMVTVKKAMILVVVAVIFLPVIMLVAWNYAWARRGMRRFLQKHHDTDLRTAIDGQYVKVTGVVTCGSIPLESSFQGVPRCVYVSTELEEYAGYCTLSSNCCRLCNCWKSAHVERYVADFYVSDSQSGLRALVKAGYGAKVATFVKPATVIDINGKNKDISPRFLQWLSEHKLSNNSQFMQLKERYIKEGNTVSVMGIVRRHDNVIMISPSQEPMSTGCQYTSCLLPMYIEGLILLCDENQNADVIAV